MAFFYKVNSNIPSFHFQHFLGHRVLGISIVLIYVFFFLRNATEIQKNNKKYELTSANRKFYSLAAFVKSFHHLYEKYIYGII